MRVKRQLFSRLEKSLVPNKVIILLGARRVGKSELIKELLKKYKKEEYLLLNGEDQGAIDLLQEASINNYKRLVRNRKLLVIDEAQKVPEIGRKLKLMIDEIEGLTIIATGSSVFDLSNKLGEPLVGRNYRLQLFPLAQMEYSTFEDLKETKEKLEERLIFGSYPELLSIPDWSKKEIYLESLISDYLFKDILEYQGIRKADKIIDLLRLLAFQIGKEVSVSELANNLKGISRNTIENYLDLLSKVFVIYPVKGFSRNLRKEISKSDRWYFYDNGIRNALIKNFNSISLRMDIGMLWENYLMAERIKYNSYSEKRVNSYFWRTYDQQEIDLIEERGEDLNAFEFKWNTNKKTRVPAAWNKNYVNAGFEIVSPSNYLDFIDPFKEN